MTTKPCPACGKELNLPVEYLNAMKNMRKAVEAFYSVIKQDIEINKQVKPHKFVHKGDCPAIIGEPVCTCGETRNG